MPNILLIEDNPGDARLIQELLSDADTVTNIHTLFHVERVSDAIKKLEDMPSAVDVVLSDISLPDSTGLDTLRSLTQAGANLPIIFMTGTNDEQLAMTAIHQGAQDYILKGRYDSDTLARTIKYAMERKKFQLELEEVKIKDRTNQERIKLLAQEKRQLVALAKAKDEFISLASHQLRTPASAVRQYLGMLLEGYAGDIEAKQLEIIQVAFDSNTRQLEVINDLLKTAQLDAENYHLYFERKDINEVLSETIINLKPSTAMRKQKIVFKPYDQLIALFDRSELYLVFENLLSNASKYSPNGSTLTVTSQPTKKYAEIRIRDNGVGIDPKDHKRIFDKFTRIDNNMSDTVNGNGLGLYWVKRIVKLHHGKITLQSALGKGTEFTVSIPL